MISWLRVSLVLLLFLPSCARLNSAIRSRSKPKEKEEHPFGPTMIPPSMRGGGTPVAAGGNVAPPSLSQITPQSEILWTDPDNPDKGIPELNDLMAGPKHGLWEEDEGIARRQAVREGKPLLIWFTDSAHSPGCKQLTAQLFDKKEFESWAKEKFVRLRVDFYPRVKDPNMSMDDAADKEARNRNRATEMNKRYKVLGYPTLLVLSNSGDVVGRYKGFKNGDGDYTWGLLKQGESLAGKSSQEWRAGLMKKGYREWQDRSGNKVFAKLVSYNKGTLIFVEPDGRRSKTVETRLSDADRDWIKQQKALRGIE
ncbi:thioredoxin family protein [Luteolibacter ambystomatis]|uniref:Thioredoxin family protein n=1 Tax=Luteolibacter ambystomatis TaxID=2824561 RepID=A0A975G9Q2_9BACT|nr:thioredoxin family protein [Luteolibacter ambystomatis]QUE51428.1 thioredoxin family protein [Luteolibacter ambystomatis]